MFCGALVVEEPDAFVVVEMDALAVVEPSLLPGDLVVVVVAPALVTMAIRANESRAISPTLLMTNFISILFKRIRVPICGCPDGRAIID